jgi:hypothetical protein
MLRIIRNEWLEYEVMQGKITSNLQMPEILYSI